MLGIHRDILRNFVSKLPVLEKKEDWVNLVHAKDSDVNNRGLVLFEPLKEEIVDISASLSCERADDEVDVSRQFSLYPAQDPITCHCTD